MGTATRSFDSMPGWRAQADDQPHGTWERTAQQVRVLAEELGIRLDPCAILWADVRDLLALRECLRHHLQHPATGSRYRQRLHSCCARAHLLLGGGSLPKCFEHVLNTSLRRR